MQSEVLSALSMFADVFLYKLFLETFNCHAHNSTSYNRELTGVFGFTWMNV